MRKFVSTKFVVTILITLLGAIVPVAFSKNGVSNEVTLAVLGLFTGVGIAYGVLNVRAEAIRSAAGQETANSIESKKDVKTA